MASSQLNYVVIVALDEEATYFRNIVSCEKSTPIAGRASWRIADPDWKLAGNGILVCAGRMGREPARRLTSEVIQQTGANVVVNVGIAGRIDPSLEIGDILVPELCIDVTEGSKISTDSTGPRFDHAPRQLGLPGPLASAAYAYLREPDYAKLLNDRLQESFAHWSTLQRRPIRIENWPLVCVPNVSAYDQYRTSLQHIDRRAGAMDMESAGVIEAAGEFGVSVLCVRGISDSGGSDKSRQEAHYKDENRRLAMEAAVFALETSLLRYAEEHQQFSQPVGLYVSTTTDPLDPNWESTYERKESLFSLLVRSSSGELVKDPVAEMAALLQDPAYTGALALLGDKGAGKTTLLQLLQEKLAYTRPQTAQSAPGAGRAVVLLRLSQIEVWRNNKLDHPKTLMRLDRCLQRIERIGSSGCHRVDLLIDGLNQTGNVRVDLVERILRRTDQIRSLRLALSAGSDLDLEALTKTGAPLNVATHFKLEPMDIEDSKLVALIDRFGNLQPENRNRFGPAEVLENMRSKEVRAVDIFMLTRFFDTFTGPVYQKKQTLAECYNTYCAALLGKTKDQGRWMSEVAEIAFDLLISNQRSISTIESRDVVSLVSDHSSITHYLVARHVVDVIVRTKSGAESRLNERLNYVFPAEVNSYTKQMMRADPKLEDDIVTVIERNQQLDVLAKSHLAYLAGRVRDLHAQRVRKFLAELDTSVLSPSGLVDNDRRMLRRTVYISRGLLKDANAEVDYVNLILTDIEEADFNRGFHLVYWGDVPFQPHVKMTYRDDGKYPCNRTFARLLDRIQSRLPHVPLIDLVTLLSLVQVRHVAGTLREHHRESVLELLKGKQLRQNFDLPGRVRGYVARIEEDLQQDTFDCGTVLQEWDELGHIERTGWLRRRKEATAQDREFWNGQRIESVAEHTISTIGLAEVFLSARPTGEEIYNKDRVIALLLIHDFAESRVGDLIQGQQNHRAELEVLYKYGAFSTYRGIGDLWDIAERFREFSEGATIEGRIALDLDRLQFVLRARSYRAGMSEKELAGCEATRGKIVTATVHRIEKLLENYPVKARFVRPEAEY